jgi:hypothetical protein
VLNFLVLTPEAKAGLVPLSEAGIRWRQRVSGLLDGLAARASGCGFNITLAGQHAARRGRIGIHMQQTLSSAS